MQPHRLKKLGAKTPMALCQSCGKESQPSLRMYQVRLR
jgi:hypothetical protein